MSTDEEKALQALLDDDEEIPDTPLQTKSTAVVDGPVQPEGDVYTKEERAKVLTRKRTVEQETDQEEAEAQHVIGDDAQPIPFDPGPVTVSQGNPDLAFAEGTLSVTVYLPIGQHPVLTWEGRWTPSDVRTLLGCIRRGWRRYQVVSRTKTLQPVKGLEQETPASEEMDDGEQG